MKDKLLLIGKIVLVSLIIFIIFKSCVKSTLSFEKAAIYEIIYEDGSVNKIFVIPPNEIILQKKIDNYFESGLYRVVGSNATHYVGPFYNVANSPLGLRIYHNADEVWNTEFTLKETIGNVETTTFSTIGSSYFNRIIFYSNSININGQAYQKKNFDFDEFDNQQALFN